MLDYQSVVGTRFSIGWEGWLLTTSFNIDGLVTSLHNQDFIHNDKKFINPMLSAIRTLHSGEDVCLHQKIGQVFNCFTFEEHGLKPKDERIGP